VCGVYVHMRCVCVRARADAMRGVWVCVHVHMRMNGSTRFPLSLSIVKRTHSDRNELGIISGERRPFRA